MARRGENIYKRKDGRWEGRYIKRRRPGKKPLYGSVYAQKHSECKKKLAQAKALYMHEEKRYKMCGTGSVSDFMIYWLYDIIQPHVKTSTFSNYAAISDKYIIPFIGDKKLRSVGREDIQFFITTLLGQDLSAGTVRNIYRVLYAAMKKAMEYDYIYGNPCEGTRLPEIKKKEAPLLTLQEQRLLEQTAQGDKNGFAILLAIYTGLRIGEICALKWNDVDLESGVIHVSRTIQRIQCYDPHAKTSTILINESVKSSHSARTIPLPACILNLFNENKNTSPGEYIFTYHKHPLEPRVLQYRFKALLKKAGLNDINFHALRHTFATRCMELCFDVKTLSEILGHASAKMTLDRYAHSQIEHKRTAMNKLDRLFYLPHKEGGGSDPILPDGKKECFSSIYSKTEDFFFE